MGRSTRVVAVIVAGITLVTYGSGVAAGGSVARKRKPRATLNSPCTLLTAKQVKQQFGGPVATPTFDPAYLSCRYLIGTNPTQAGGTVSVVQLFPNYLQKTSTTAKAAYEDEHAVDTLSDDVLSDVNGVGRAAYMNLTKGTLVVLATKKFLFTITWVPTPTRKINARDIRGLTRLAKLTVPRAPI